MKDVIFVDEIIKLSRLDTTANGKGMFVLYIYYPNAEYSYRYKTREERDMYFDKIYQLVPSHGIEIEEDDYR